MKKTIVIIIIAITISISNVIIIIYLLTINKLLESNILMYFLRKVQDETDIRRNYQNNCTLVNDVKILLNIDFTLKISSLYLSFIPIISNIFEIIHVTIFFN